MKLSILITIIALFCLADSHMQLRRHEMPFLDSMNPLEMAQFMSGDYAAILPKPLQAIARKITGQEQSTSSKLLDKAGGLFGGGSSSSSGGMFGGMGDLFAGVSDKKDNGIFDSFKSMMGGSDNKKKDDGMFGGLLPSPSSLLPFHE